MHQGFIWLTGEAASIVLLPWRGWKYLKSTTWSPGIVTAGLYLFSAACQTEVNRENNMGQMFWPHSTMLQWWDTASLIFFPVNICQEQYLLLHSGLVLFMEMSAIHWQRKLLILTVSKCPLYSIQKYINLVVNINNLFFRSDKRYANFKTFFNSQNLFRKDLEIELPREK